MARTFRTNFQYYSGPRLRQETVRAVDSDTWYAGAPGYMNAGAATPVATDGQKVHFLFAEDQTTATSSSDVLVNYIDSASTKFIGFVSADADDTTAAAANVGEDYGIHVGDNSSSEEVASVNKSETSSTAVVVDKLMSTADTREHASTDSPARVIFHFKQSVLDAS